jgi:hypothetical protein
VKQKRICNVSNGDNEMDDEDIETAVSMIEKQSTIKVEHAAINSKTFLDEYKYGKRKKEETTKVIIAPIVELIQNAEKDTQQYLFNIVNKSRYESTENDENDVRSELIVEKEKMKIAPLLTQFGIPIHSKVLSVCLKEIVSISKQFPKESIMKYTNWMGKETQVVQIPVCGNKKSFLAMNNHRTRFLDELPMNIKGGNMNITNGEVVHWIMERLGGKYEYVLLDICSLLGILVVSRRMDKDTAQATWDEGNVNISTQRVILRYLWVTFGGLCIIPATKAFNDGKIDNSDGDELQKGSYKSVAPITNVIDIDGDRVHYWTNPLIPLLNF